MDLTFKVFPQPRSYVTLELGLTTLGEALEGLSRLRSAGFDLEALDLQPPGRLWIRLGGSTGALAQRLDRLRNLLGAGEARTGEEESSLWESTANFDWAPAGSFLVKIPVTEDHILPLEEHLSRTSCQRRYCAAGNLLWLAWPDALEPLEGILKPLGLGGLVLDGPTQTLFIGAHEGFLLGQKVKRALDPQGRFPDF